MYVTSHQPWGTMACLSMAGSNKFDPTTPFNQLHIERMLLRGMLTCSGTWCRAALRNALHVLHVIPSFAFAKSEFTPAPCSATNAEGIMWLCGDSSSYAVDSNHLHKHLARGAARHSRPLCKLRLMKMQCMCGVSITCGQYICHVVPHSGGQQEAISFRGSYAFEDADLLHMQLCTRLPRA